MTMDANLLLAHNDELTLFRQQNCGQKQSDELGACCWLSFAASSSTAHVIKVKRSDLTDPAPESFSAHLLSITKQMEDGGIRGTPLLARHMHHIKQTVREKVKGWKVWQHRCICAVMVMKYIMARPLKNDESLWQRCPYQAASWWSARAVWHCHCQHGRDGLPFVCVWIQSTATCPLAARGRFIKRITV
jgi:hypothetical protein